MHFSEGVLVTWKHIMMLGKILPGKILKTSAYVDVCSWYPWVLKTGFFPVGHPKVYINGDCENIAPNNIDNIQMLMKCRVLPPRSLYHPVLPVRAHDKLFFALCMSCCQNQIQTECPHENERDRELYGTWVTCKLRKAIEKTYVIENIDEFRDYQVVQYISKEKNSTGLFVEYINTFLKSKQKASKWPSQCNDEISKREYLTRYEDREGIKLNPTKIIRNPGLRYLVKLF